GIDDKFKVLKSIDIKNVDELNRKLKNKKNIKELSNDTSIKTDYLTILRRYVNSFHPPPRKIGDFPSLSHLTVDKLEKMGITTTPQLYDKLVTKELRNNLKTELGVADEEILILTKLADVSRLKYVSPIYATLIVYSDYDTVQKIRNADYNDLHNQLVKINKEKNLYKGRINLKDIKYLVNETDYVTLDVEY
ncbi:MAG: DUF4332 domain-containing protein, partial [Methanobacterium sp.]|nr:DUF4332 domain-containing protein [Methanobacterium sp.]